MFSVDDTFGYAAALLGVAPLATQVGLAPISWTLLFPIIALPCVSLLLSIGSLSNCGALLTYKRIAPIASGIGWALTWFVGERLFVEGLRGAQNLLYIFFSLRSRLDWAIDCKHSYNSEHCVPFFENFTVAPEDHYPNNLWPAQEFNRHQVRGNPITKNISIWEPNEWYLGHSTDQFYLSLPSLGLLLAHTFIWLSIFFCLNKLVRGGHEWFTRVFVILPVGLYIALIMGMSISGFHFGLTLTQDISVNERDKDPLDFWADIRGLYRTSLLLVDYTGAFTGMLLFATSRVRTGASPINSLLLTPALMVVPILLTILRSGCEGHVADQQPNYKVYTSTDETMSFDLLPVCFATSHAGPLWAIIYYTAQLLYTTIGPMVIYVSFIYQTFIEEFPAIQNKSTLFFSALVACFAAPSVFLYMPMGTKVITFLRYVSQASIIHIICFVVIFLIYGWQTIEADILTSTNEVSSVSLTRYLVRPSSPIYTVLLFTLIPALLFSKFAAVFDLLATGNDIVKHIDTGSLFIPVPLWLRRLLGYGVMFAPLLIVTVIASYVLYSFVVRHKLSALEAFKPSPDWMAHSVVSNSRPRLHSLAYGLCNSLFNFDYQVALFFLMIAELVIFFVLLVVFTLNSNVIPGIGLWSSSTSANDYRSAMLFSFVILHAWSLFELKWTKASWDSPEKMSFYIGVATMEMAMFNGYMWMFTTDHDHKWGIDWPPLLSIICITIIRGSLISLAIAIRAHLREIARPTRTRDATEIYDVDTGIEVDAEDDSPVIFDLARA